MLPLRVSSREAGEGVPLRRLVFGVIGI